MKTYDARAGSEGSAGVNQANRRETHSRDRDQRRQSNCGSESKVSSRMGRGVVRQEHRRAGWVQKMCTLKSEFYLSVCLSVYLAWIPLNNSKRKPFVSVP